MASLEQISARVKQLEREDVAVNIKSLDEESLLFFKKKKTDKASQKVSKFEHVKKEDQEAVFSAASKLEKQKVAHCLFNALAERVVEAEAKDRKYYTKCVGLAAAKSGNLAEQSNKRAIISQEEKALSSLQDLCRSLQKKGNELETLHSQVLEQSNSKIESVSESVKEAIASMNEKIAANEELTAQQLKNNEEVQKIVEEFRCKCVTDTEISEKDLQNKSEDIKILQSKIGDRKRIMSEATVLVEQTGETNSRLEDENRVLKQVSHLSLESSPPSNPRLPSSVFHLSLLGCENAREKHSLLPLSFAIL